MFKKLLVILSLIAFSTNAEATVTANSSVTPQTPNRGIVQFLQGTDAAGTYKTLYTGGANGSIVKGIFATSNDASAAHLVTCQIVNGGVKYGGVAATVAINSGMANAAPPVNLMSPSIWTGLPLDSDGNPFFFLASANDTLQCTYATALTTSDAVSLIAVAADF